MYAIKARIHNVPVVDAEHRVAIIDALYRFGAGQDLHDRGLFASAFSSEAQLDFVQPAKRFGVDLPVMRGRDAIVDNIMAATEHLDTTHTITNLRVTAYDGQCATLFALVEAQHLPQGGHPSHLLLKNIYTLELSKVEGLWVIDHMLIENVWMTGDPRVLFPAVA